LFRSLTQKLLLNPRKRKRKRKNPRKRKSPRRRKSLTLSKSPKILWALVMPLA